MELPALTISLTSTPVQLYADTRDTVTSLNEGSRCIRIVKGMKLKCQLQPSESSRNSTDRNISMSAFELSQLEMENIEELKVRAFSVDSAYILNQFLPKPNETETEPATIYYMELLDENPDTDEAMLQVAELLIEAFTSNDHQKHVILVGDGKTYQHLMNIKCQYGDTLEQLLIFPGDWHILKNYQIVLMKVYSTAGLKDLAAKSGYRGQTLKSLETSGSFKRTHRFLLQA